MDHKLGMLRRDRVILWRSADPADCSIVGPRLQLGVVVFITSDKVKFEGGADFYEVITSTGKRGFIKCDFINVI